MSSAVATPPERPIPVTSAAAMPAAAHGFPAHRLLRFAHIRCRQRGDELARRREPTGRYHSERLLDRRVDARGDPVPDAPHGWDRFRDPFRQNDLRGPARVGRLAR